MNITVEGVILLPWSLAITSAWPFLKTATQQYVVPKSIPIAVSMPRLPSSDSSSDKLV